MTWRSSWQKGVGLAFLTTWSSGASALDLVLSGAVERGSGVSRVEVFASLVVPLQEWVAPLPEVSHWVRASPVHLRVWDEAERAAVAATGRVEFRYFGQAEFGQTEQTELPGAARAPATPKTLPPSRSSVLPKVNTVFVKALMAACSHEFKDSRSQLEDLADRARLSAWLPEIQVKGGRNTDQTLRLTPTDAEPDRYQVVGGNGVRLEGQLRWSFNQLVFARDELTVARLRGALDVEKRKRQQQAMTALSKWLAAWMTLATRNADEPALLEAWVAESALRAELDWLSQGWFSDHVPAAPAWDELALD